MGLGFISDVDEILHFSELGVVFLMFIIGLELNPPNFGNCGVRFWRRRGTGAVKRGVVGGIIDADGFRPQAAVVGGIGLAMSSTAMALQLMREKG